MSEAKERRAPSKPFPPAGLTAAEFQSIYRLQPLYPLPQQLTVLSHACLASGDYLVIFAQAPYLLFQVTAKGIFMHEADRDEFPELTFHRGSPFAVAARTAGGDATEDTAPGGAVPARARAESPDPMQLGGMIPEHLRSFCSEKRVWRVTLDGVHYFADESFRIFARMETGLAAPTAPPPRTHVRNWHPREGDVVPDELFDGPPEATESGMWRIRVRGDKDNIYITDEQFRLLYSVRQQAYRDMQPSPDGEVVTLDAEETLEPPGFAGRFEADRTATPVAPLLAEAANDFSLASPDTGTPVAPLLAEMAAETAAQQAWRPAYTPGAPVSPPAPPPEKELPASQLVPEMLRLVRGDREDSGLLARNGITASFFRDTILQPGRKELFARAFSGDIDADLLGDKKAPSTDERIVLRRHAGTSLLKAVLLHNLYINSVKSQRGDDLPEERGRRMRGFLRELIPWQQRPQPEARVDREPMLRHFQRLGLLSHFESKKLMIDRVYMQIEADPEYRLAAQQRAELLDVKTLLIYKLYAFTNIADRGNGVEMILLVKEIIEYPK